MRGGVAYGMAALAALVAIVVQSSPGVAIGAAMLFLALVVGAMAFGRPMIDGAKGTREADRSVLLSLMWWAVILGSVHKFEADRDPLAVVRGQVGLQNLVEMGIYGLVGLTAAYLLLRVPAQHAWRGGRSVHALWFWYALTAVSSVALKLTAVRLLQFAIVLLLLTATMRLVGTRGGLEFYAAFVRVSRWVGVAVATASLAWISTTGIGTARATWYGVHPVAAGQIYCVLLIAAVSNVIAWRHRVVGLWPAVWATAILLNQTRAVLVAAAVALLLAGSAVRVSETGWAFRKRAPLVPLALGVGAVVFAQQLMNYAMRDAGIAQLWSINNRSELWSEAVHIVAEASRLETGFGYDASQVVLFGKAASFAGHAHSLPIELVVTGGIGALAIGVWILLALWFRVRCAWVRSRALTLTATAAAYIPGALMVLVASLAVTDDSFASPGEGLGIMSLCYVLASLLCAKDGYNGTGTMAEHGSADYDSTRDIASSYAARSRSVARLGVCRER